MIVESWAETNDRDIALVAATLGCEMRKFRPITETWNEKTECVKEYHFLGPAPHPRLGLIGLPHIAAVVTGKAPAVKGKLRPPTIWLVQLILDFVQNNRKLREKFLWADDRIVLIACITLGFRWKPGHSSFLKSFPYFLDDANFGRIRSQEVGALVRRSTMPHMNPLLVEVCNYFADAYENEQTFQDWEKNKVQPMVTIGGKRYDMTLALDHPGKVVDDIRKFEKTYGES